MVRLQSLQISHFRGIRTGRIEGLTDVNVFIGRNNSGKTTLMEAITRLPAKIGVGLDILERERNTYWQNVRQGVGGALLFYRQDRSSPIEITAGLADGNGKYVIRDFVPENDRRKETPNPTDQPTGQDVLAYFRQMVMLRPQDVFLPTIEQKFWPTLLSDRRDKALTAALNNVFGLKAESFQLLPNNQLTVLFENYSLPLDSQGDGTRTALRTMMVLAMMRGTLLMLEEPECYQHPGSLERFSAALCKQAKAQDVQLIISTHSAECVGAFLRAAARAESNAAVFHLKLEDGQQEARRLDPAAVSTLEGSGIDVRQLDLYA